MEKNKEKIDKPEWFDLTKYKPAEQLSLHHWFIELTIRHNLLNYVIDNRSVLGSDGTFKKVITGIRKNALITSFGITPSTSFSSEYVNLVEEGLLTDAIRLSNLGDVSNLKIDGDFENPLEPYDIHKFNQSAEQPSTIHLSVRLDAPDSVILENMKALLKSVRKRFDSKSKVTASDDQIKSWINAQVLPYIDIYIWAVENGIDIQEDIGFAEVARWIPPINQDKYNHPKDDTERGLQIKRTTHKKAMELMDPDYIARIGSNLLSQDPSSKFNIFK
jgi:hypothetical protein